MRNAFWGLGLTMGLAAAAFAQPAPSAANVAPAPASAPAAPPPAKGPVPLMLHPMSAPAPVVPPDPARLAAARDLIVAMRYRDTMMKVLDQQRTEMVSLIDRISSSAPMGSVTPAELADFKKKMFDTWWRGVNPDGLVEDQAVVYAQVYTLDQLKAIAAFYRTPAGQAMVDASVNLSTKSMAILSQHLRASIPQMQQMQKDFQAAHTPKPAASGTTPVIKPAVPGEVKVESVVPNALCDAASRTSALGTTRSTE